jgi:hypothetical protein
VVPADADRTDPGEPLDDAIGLGAVADDIAAVPHRIDRSEVGEDRVERDEIAMDVRQDGDPHRPSG